MSGARLGGESRPMCTWWAAAESIPFPLPHVRPVPPHTHTHPHLTPSLSPARGVTCGESNGIMRTSPFGCGHVATITKSVVPN